jgi:NhaC family Na+:H+ antiporter
MSEDRKEIPLGVALIPVLFLIGALALVISVYDLSPHIPLIGAAAVAGGVAVVYKRPWEEIQHGMAHGINLAMGAILILMVVGIMIGTWILGGVVPTMVYYGLKVLSPGIFLVATMIICSIVSLGTGSSWSTAGTVGVALIGVGSALSIPLPMVAGAIISGAYFGDKMSPLSDTTNLAPAMAGTDVFTHIRHMVYTTVPGFVLALILFALIGLKFTGGSLEAQNIEAMLTTMSTAFVINPWLLVPPALVIVMVVRKIPPLPALLGGAALGGVFAMLFQSSTLAQVVDVAHAGYVSQTGIESVDELLSRGGLLSMMETVALIMCALCFGGIMESTKMLQVIAHSLLKMVKGTGSLVATTVFSCIGRMYKNAYDEQGLHPKNLSRALEDSGTLTSPLIPWNTCGAFMWATLGVNPLLYLPYAFMNLANPLVSLLYGFTGFTMEKMDKEEGAEELVPEPVAVQQPS